MATFMTIRLEVTDSLVLALEGDNATPMMVLDVLAPRTESVLRSNGTWTL